MNELQAIKIPQDNICKNENIILSTFLFFSFIFDSGGGIGIRNIGFLIIALIIFLDLLFYKNVQININFLLFYCGNLVFLSLSILAALNNNTTFFKANLFNFSLYCLFPFYILAKNKYLTIEGYLKSIEIFCVVIVIFFFGRLLKIMPIVNVFNILTRNASGHFQNLYFENSSTVLPNVYFQGVLSIVPAAVIMITQKKYKSFFLAFIALCIAPSRFGVLVCAFFFLILHIRKLFIPILVGIVLVLLFLVFKIEIPVFIDFLNMFYRTSSGNVIRSGHLNSIISLLTENPSYLFIGQGPGSMFYTSGFHHYADSVEISHFDFLRKYGILYFSVVNAAFIYLLYKLCKKKSLISNQLVYGLLAHYIVSISNPVLLSLPFIMFTSICIVRSEIKN